MDGALVDSFTGLSIWIQVVVVLLCSVLAARVIKLVGSAALRRSGLGKSGYDRIIIEEVHAPLYITVFLAGVYVSTQLVDELLFEFYITSTVVSSILLIWAYAVTRVGGRLITATNDTRAGREIAPIFRNVLTFFVVLGSFFVLLSVWQVDITPLLASAGVIGIVLGIAARDTIGNFFAGISLYLDNTYKNGDMIQLESGERGTVIDMSIRSTTILTRDNIAITVPNSVLNTTQVVNESAPVRRRRVRLNVGVAYGSNLDTVEQALLDVADEEALVLDSPKSVVRFREFADSAIVAQLQCFIENPALRGRVRHRLIQRIDERFRENDIKIPFPQQEVTFFEAGNTIAFEHATDPTEESAPITVDDMPERN